MADKEIKELTAKRGLAKSSITRLVTFADKITERTQRSEIATRLEYLERAFNEFVDCEIKLAKYDVASELDEYETKYFNVKTKFKESVETVQQDDQKTQVEKMMSRILKEQNEFLTTLSSSFTTSMNQTIHNTTGEEPHVSIRLPQLRLPKFSGNYADFKSFKDIFVASVHSKLGFSDVQKFQYLKGQLEGEAADLIKHITVSDVNYLPAWEKICERYDKEKFVLNSLIKSFLEQPVIQQPSIQKLRQLYNGSDEVNRGVVALGGDATKRDPWLIYILLNKTDADTREAWAHKTVNKDYPTYDEFLKFLCERCDALESCAPMKQGSIKSSTVKIHHVKPVANSAAIECVYCKSSHRLCHCEKFKMLSPSERRELTAKLRLCFNCLSESHRANACLNKFNCLKCNRRHHTLLHDTTTSSMSNSATIDKEETPESPSNPNAVKTIETNTCNVGNTILPTAIVRVESPVGHTSVCKLLLDSGSQASFISLSCAKRLSLCLNNCRLRIEGIATSNVSTMGSTELTISSRFDMSQSLHIKVFVLPKITTVNGNYEIESRNINQLSKLPLADPRFHERNEVDILLGADYFFHVLKPKQIRLAGNCIAQDTQFGYVIAGMQTDINQSENHLLKRVFNTTIIDECSLEKLLQRFWEQEEISDNPTWTAEEEACESHFKATHFKNQEGRYVVELPLKPDSPPLGESYKMALQRLLAMERKMHRNKEFGRMYRNFMQEYLDMGHMRAIQKDSENAKAQMIYYLPHHGVLRENSTTTKLRVVFDGSAPTSTGVSVNKRLLVGPTLQGTLWTILIRFRCFKVALCADIEKMYRQVFVNEKHRSLQRILWRKCPDDVITHFELQTVTYGTASAPFLAIRVLHQIAEDCKITHPELSKIITSNFYVDDLLAGATSEEIAVQLKADLTKVLAANGYPLRKWRSNISKLNDSKEVTEIVEEGQLSQMLGLHWDSQKDQFTFQIYKMPQDICTKRNILSIASKIFDPLGWLNPFTINIKIFMQTLWLRKVSWDDPLADDLRRYWETLFDQFIILNQIGIPRFVGDLSDDAQLHGFSDASEVAYSAAVYVRTRTREGYVVHLLTSKSKVAPIKQISLPRLELCGAHLLAKLVKAVAHAYDKPSIPIWLWTDSMVVLSWLKGHPRKWKNYIANRVGAIHTLTPEAIWRHVRGSENPADLATRGVAANELIQSELWLKGPQWLSYPEEKWPIQSIIHDTDEEFRSTGIKTCQATICTNELHPVHQLFQRCSNWPTLIRIMAYILRFIYILKTKIKESIQLEVRELNTAELILIRHAQRTEFADDIKYLNKYKQIPFKSKLKQLAPFMDSDDILRVGGRLQNSICSYDTKHPMILPKNHVIATLILNDLHRKHLHPGPSLLTAISRQKYWILGVRDICRKITHKCITCYRYCATKSSQQMGSLPAARVTPSRPFSVIGIDYAGPIQLSSKIGRGAKLIKGFIVIFVCFATKALHIEVASSLSTQAFINALERFVGRRGVPMEIYTDNGSNFLGAKRMLHEYYSILTSDESEIKIKEFARNKGIKWHLIPPLSPHFGGIWERAVKSVKTHLIKSIGKVNRTFEEIQTVLNQIEGILNSRPLCAITNEDTSNIDSLTPGHFLTLGPITALPHPNYEEINMTRLNRWEQTQKIVQIFWQRYSLTYLNTLQQRTKWHQRDRNLQINDVVLLYDKNAAPCTWPLGRVKELHPGADGLVRVATVQTSSSVYKRPISKLYRLPIND